MNNETNKWTIFNKKKKIKTLCDGKLVLSAPYDTSSLVPLFCPCCAYPMKSSEDSISFRKHGVCSACDNRWTNKPGIVWPDGPDKSSKEWAEYITQRTLTSRPVIVFK